MSTRPKPKPPLPVRVQAEVRRILDREARRLLAERTAERRRQAGRRR